VVVIIYMKVVLTCCLLSTKVALIPGCGDAILPSKNGKPLNNGYMGARHISENQAARRSSQ
jgi:hypothetical protein